VLELSILDGIARNRSAMKTLSNIQISRHPRQLLLQLSTALLASLLLAAAGQVMAQNTGGNAGAGAQQSSEDAGKAEAEKRRQAEADEAARKAEARKPKRDKSADDKDPERELEEEEDI
jgi:hypothetical protein